MVMRSVAAGDRLRWLGIVSGVLVIVGLLILVTDRHPTRERKIDHLAAPAGRAKAEARQTPRPIPEPLKIVALTPDQARVSNAGVPIVSGRATVAKPFTFTGSLQDRAAAQACLAAAIYYEAGDDAEGEQAVAQVVLNRVRHPAFPKTVCGVVFEGSARTTGCQFTFSCDNSLSRVARPAAVNRARDIADAALSGRVQRSAGLATYYHADWVVPYWRDTLDKVATIRGQIYYRWRGAWGRPAAFDRQAAGPETPDPRIAAFTVPPPIGTGPTDDGPVLPRLSLSIDGVPRAALKGAIVRLKDDDAAQYVLQLAPDAGPRNFPSTAFTICAEKPNCLVLAWADERDVPRSLPVFPMQMRSLAFLYRKSSVTGQARSLWDCHRYPRPTRSECIS